MHGALYLSVSTVCKAQVCYDGVYLLVFICCGVILRVQTQVGTEKQVLSHAQSPHQNIILEPKGRRR